MTHRIAPMIAEPVDPTPRAKLGAAIRTALRAAQDGLCAMCGKPLPEGPELDHRIPLALGGKDQPSNWQLLCPKPCHAIKTAQDVKAIAKAKRIKAKHEGTAPPPLQRIHSRGFQRRWPA